tara:strand:+ start:160 stop:888 length:729 start_codon:yes stop_codon:yes gene_type:complete
MSKTNPGLSIVIPIFNEEGNIPELFRRIKIFNQEVDFNHEFIIVDGNSSDSSVSIIERLAKENKEINFSLIKMNKKYGYGFDIMTGIKAAQFDYLSWTHADLQTDINDLKIGYALIQNSKIDNVLKGKRKNRPILPELFTFGMQVYVFLKLGIFLSDINAQPKMFSRKFYEEYLIEEAPNDFSLDLYLLAMAKINNIPISEFSVFFKKRTAGTAKGGGGSWRNRLSLIKRTVQYINNLSNLN